jgi:enoyl-CoA hydratase
MTYENLLIKKSGNFVLITINRPQALNALNTKTMEELGHFFETGFKHHADIRGVIITGAGEKAFVAGADIKEFLALDVDGGKSMSARGHEIFNRIEQFHVPVVAAINGFALGGGLELAMACHLRIASDTARFGQPEVNLGLIPGYGGTQRLIQMIGKTKAIELLMTADMISAAQAVQLGLINAIATQDDLLTAAFQLLEKISTKAPLAIQEIISTVNAYFDNTRDGFQAEIDAFGRCTQTEDFEEGAQAFIDKRKPVFNGK